MERFMAVVKIKEGKEQKDFAHILPEETKQLAALVHTKVIDPYYTIEGFRIFWTIINAENISEAGCYIHSLPLYLAGFMDIEIYQLLKKNPV